MRIEHPVGVGILFILGAVLGAASSISAGELEDKVRSALIRADDNRPEIEQAIANAPVAQRQGMRFLVAYMPDRDLRSLSADFLLRNLRFAYRARDESRWKNAVPDEVFFNNVLPYASINERRDMWRQDFFEKFKPLVKDAATPGKAAAILNRKIFPQLDVRYSTKRRRADQSPYESIKTGLASCTGLSVLLIDACRAVGVPARFVGTPLWSDRSGNHSWVEVWDDGWHFTGAAEPTGDTLDRAWFIDRASAAARDDRLHAVYAVSYKHTPQRFPLVWDRSVDYVFAVNVTDRYTQLKEDLPDGFGRIRFQVLDKTSGSRLPAALQITDTTGNTIFTGVSNDDRFDANDHVTVPLRLGTQYEIELRHNGNSAKHEIVAGFAGQLITLQTNG